MSDTVTAAAYAAGLTPFEARALTDEIRQTLTLGHDLLIRAFTGRAWTALGYATWDAYCAGEFYEARMVRLDREQRREIVAEMYEAGMSQPAIAAGLGVGVGTVNRDLDTAFPDGKPDRPTTGKDGKTYERSPHDEAGVRALSPPGPETSPVALPAETTGAPVRPGPAAGEPKRGPRPTAPAATSKDAAAVAQREAVARELAATGHTSAQIATALGMSEGGTKNLCSRAGIDVPADKVLGRARRLDGNRVIEQTVRAAEPSPDLLAAVDFSELDRSLLGEWISSLSESLKALRSLKTALEKELFRVSE